MLNLENLKSIPAYFYVISCVSLILLSTAILFSKWREARFRRSIDYSFVDAEGTASYPLQPSSFLPHTKMANDVALSVSPPAVVEESLRENDALPLSYNVPNDPAKYGYLAGRTLTKDEILGEAREIRDRHPENVRKIKALEERIRKEDLAHEERMRTMAVGTRGAIPAKLIPVYTEIERRIKAGATYEELMHDESIRRLVRRQYGVLPRNQGDD